MTSLRGTEAAESRTRMNSKLEVGTHVIFITPERIAVNALIEVVHVGYKKESVEAWEREGRKTSSELLEKMSAEEHKEAYGQWPCVNLTYIQPDPKMVDQYGRQKGHASSCSHGNVQGNPQGYCWIFPEEAPEQLRVGERVIFDKPV